MKHLLLAVAVLFGMSGSALACVNVDSASAKELEKLSSVGPATAKSIVNYRKAQKTAATKAGKKSWSFGNWKTLMSVKGVGPDLCKKNIGKVCFGSKIQKSCPKG